ncbi:MAG TPA: ATP-binding protein, partial [Cyclobacteriaceae bacterium]|nr:ATP-binding protein [Cyclobacteriaceae bacterium]
SGVPKEAFSKFPMPRNTAIFNPTFIGSGTVRYDDVTKQPHFGKNAPYYGMPKGHLPVKSYLAVSVVSSFSNEVIGGLFFGHPEPGVFTDQSEKLVEGIAAQAAIAMANARLFEEKKQTEKKLIEQNATINSMNDALELRVKERTAELEKINYELLQFTSVASHDLKEPLRKISIFSKMLRDSASGSLDEFQKKYVDNIIQSSGRMTALIEDLLQFSRLSQEKFSFEPVDLNKLLAQITSDLEIMIQEKKATISFDGLPVIRGIELQLGQLFQNLVSNSLKFADLNRPPVITVTSTRVAKDNKPFHRIVFSDNGIGFENSSADKIFEVFQRLHTRDEYEGTGVGLAIVKKIVMMHGGEIKAIGYPSQGATIEILLPDAEVRGE